MNQADVLEGACKHLAMGDVERARRLLIDQYPAVTGSPVRQSLPITRLVRLFERDRYIDRYSGVRLVFPGTLRLISLMLPEEFPFHSNWKQELTHPAYWELYPTVDHIVPVARGGTNEDSNLVTTSMLRNLAKANWLLQELGWPLLPQETERSWDGLVGWFVQQCTEHSELRRQPAFARWHRAVRETRPF